MEKEKISIIVPIYNVEPFVRKCISSLINQTYKNLEIILVDDGSPDNSGKIADAFAKMDKRIKVIHQKNKGLCGARNSGLNAATGKYIGFVDSDDWITPDMYEYLYNAIKKYDVDISACRYFRVRNNQINVKTDGLVHVYNKDEVINDIVQKYEIRSIYCNKLFKKELFEGFKFPEGTIFEGTSTMHNIIKKINKLAFMPEAKYYYLDNTVSIVNTKNIKNQGEYVLSFIKRYNDLEKEYPNLRKDMMLSILKNSVTLLSILNRFPVKERKKYTIYYDNIWCFFEKNMAYIKKMSETNFITIWKIKTFKNVNKLRLMLIEFIKKISSRFKKIKKSLDKKFNKKRMLPPQYSVVMQDLTEEDKKIFKELHEKEITIMDELVRICKKHNLTYFLYGGTLLGAVRHKGFIPWDDDIDIIMPREDYNELEKVIPKELKKEFYYQNHKTDKEYFRLFSKIRLNNTFVYEEDNLGKDLHQGIFIDILPLDLFPEKKALAEKILLERFNILNCACQNDRCITQYLISKLIFKIYKLFPNEYLQKKRDEFITKYSKLKKTSLVCSFGSHYRPLKRRVMKKEWFEDTGLTMEFEGKQYSVPKGWKEYLIHLFGPNYMDLPPDDKRVNHFNFYEVKFKTKD